MQLEKAINKALKSGDSQPLAEFLKWDIHEGTHIHCSEQFLTKLDKLISRVRCTEVHSMIFPDTLVALWNHTYIFYEEFGSKWLPVSHFGSSRYSEVWETPETSSWLSRSAWNDSPRLAHKDKYSSKDTKCAVWVIALNQLLIGSAFVHMVLWFEKCRQLWIQYGPRWNETLLNLSEDFFDALMVS